MPQPAAQAQPAPSIDELVNLTGESICIRCQRGRAAVMDITIEPRAAALGGYLGPVKTETRQVGETPEGVPIRERGPAPEYLDQALRIVGDIRDQYPSALILVPSVTLDALDPLLDEGDREHVLAPDMGTGMGARVRRGSGRGMGMAMVVTGLRRAARPGSRGGSA